MRATNHKGPLVGILMNCFNGEKYLRASLESVLAQTYKNWQLVFWDNQSTDESAAIFQSYKDSRLQYFLAPKHTNLGGGRAKAYPLLNGEFIAILDTDDLWVANKLEEQLKSFDDDKVGISITNTEFFSEKRSKIFYKDSPPKGWITNALLNNYYVSLETLMLRSSSVKSLKYAFDPDFSHIADFDLVVRLSTIAKLVYVPKILAKWRVHHSSGTSSSKEDFALETKNWIMKNANTSIFIPHQKAMHNFNNNNNIQLIKHLLMSSHIADARVLLTNVKMNSWKAYVIYAICYLPVLNYLISIREHLLKRYWY